MQSIEECKLIGRTLNFPVLLGIVSFLMALGTSSAAKLHLKVKAGLKYDPAALHVQPGEKVELLFDNIDEMMHNFVLVAPGARKEVVEAAIALGSDGPAKHYVPDSPKVLASSPVVLPGKKAVVKFKAPSAEGEYPYVCTFPGHGFVMHGILFVAKERPEKMDRILAQDALAVSPDINLSSPADSATAIVHRTFMPNSSPAAIAVSLPGGHSFCWDAGNCRLRYVWRGGFIKKNGSFGRWRTLPTIEGQIYHQESNFPIRFESWNEQPPETDFMGYRMVGGIPEFRYQANGVEFTEFLAKLPGMSGLSRRFKIENPPSDLFFKVDPDEGVEMSCGKQMAANGMFSVSREDAKDFTVIMREVPNKAPLLYLSMNDLAVCYNRKGNLHPGIIGQSWLINGGKSVTPAQEEGNYAKGAAVSAWVKLRRPTEPIPVLLKWQSGGALSYSPREDAFAFGILSNGKNNEKAGWEAEEAKFKGPSKNANNSGYFGRGYLDFGNQNDEFIEWSVTIKKTGKHSLRFRYASLGKRPLKLTIDNDPKFGSTELAFPSTGNWTNWKYLEHSQFLTAGKHSIRLTSFKKTGPNLDRIELVEAGEEKQNRTEVPPGQAKQGQPLLDEEWHLLCLSMSKDSVRMYLDGKLHRERALESDESLPAGPISFSSGNRHDGFYLDEVRIYQRPLGEDEIRRLASPLENKK